MMDEPLDEMYFKWLYSQVENAKLKNPRGTYWRLLRVLHTKEFVWFVPNDDNRLEDGRELRYEFLEDKGIHEIDRHWIEIGCSMLELLIGLAIRSNFEDGRTIQVWFWTMMRNIGLDGLNDATAWSEQDVVDVLDTVIFRTYKPNGRGGLFPLKRPDTDQREVELWYQMNAYLLENGG
jgi:hypothetical protein